MAMAMMFRILVELLESRVCLPRASAMAIAARVAEGRSCAEFQPVTTSAELYVASDMSGVYH